MSLPEGTHLAELNSFRATQKAFQYPPALDKATEARVPVLLSNPETLKRLRTDKLHPASTAQDTLILHLAQWSIEAAPFHGDHGLPTCHRQCHRQGRVSSWRGWVEQLRVFLRVPCWGWLLSYLSGVFSEGTIAQDSRCLLA